MRFGISSLITLAVAARAVATQATEKKPSLNPPPSVVRYVDFANLPAAVEPATNAKRFAQGLPPMKPRGRKYQRAGSHVDVGNQRCNILVKASSTTLGYLFRSFDDIGEYGRFVPTQEEALEVQFSYLPDLPTQLDLYATNGRSPAYPYVGGVVQYDGTDYYFARGSSAFANIGGIKQTPPGSPPVEGDTAFSEATRSSSKYESAIWSYNPVTNDIIAQWINTDGSAPPTYVVHAKDGDADLLLLTGDPAAMRRDYSGDYPEATLTCVAPQSAQSPV